MLDTKILNSLRTLGEDFLHELIDIYLRDVPGLVNQLEKALQTGDAEIGSMAAHSLKGSSYSLGVKAVGDICNDLESAFDDHILYGLAEKIEQLKMEQRQAETELKHLQKQLIRSMQVEPHQKV